MDYVTLACCSVLGLFCFKFKISRPAILLTYIIIDKWQNLGQQLNTMYTIQEMMVRPLFLVLLAGVLFLVYRSITKKNRCIDYA